MKALIHRLLYRVLSLESYLRVVSRLYFICMRLGVGRRSEAMEYAYHLPNLVRKGDVCIDIGANLGYYSRPLAKIVGSTGRVYAVEPVPIIGKVLQHNLRGCDNVLFLPYALGEQTRRITMTNSSALQTGYFGTGQNRVDDTPSHEGTTFEAEMRCGSELFAEVERIDFIKCDIEGYELHVMREMRPLLERHRPTILIESGGENRRAIIEMFRELGYEAFMLDGGREIPLTEKSEKDIIFRVKH